MRVALVTATAFADLDEELPLLAVALAARGHEAAVVAWDDPTADWATFDAAVIRSTWDYVDRREEFLAWADRVDGVARLANPPALVRWNSSKRYLRALEAAGVPIVPTAWPADEDIPATWTEIVVKPAVSAGSRWTLRCRDHEEAAAFARTLAHRGEDVLAQPYVAAVDRHGEADVFFFGGRPSHAVRKGAVLAAGHPPAADFALAIGQPVEPLPLHEAPTDFARSVLDAIRRVAPGGRDLLYARVDCVTDDDGAPRVLEVELVEPSLFLATSDGAADRYAAAVDDWLRR